MKVGSLFSGIGGLDLGLERAGMQVVWQVENDEYARKVLRKHWPHVSLYGDIKAIDFTGIEPVDLICGGFPCQPVSCAGKRQGDKDERWLWPEFYRAVCEARPQWVLVENVPGLLSADRGRLFGGILRDLARSGYDAEWDLLPAAAFGAPHLRFRLFLVAYSSGTGRLGANSDQRKHIKEREPRWADKKKFGQLGKGNCQNDVADAELRGWDERGKPTGWQEGPEIERLCRCGRETNVADRQTESFWPGFCPDESRGEWGKRPCHGDCERNATHPERGGLPQRDRIFARGQKADSAITPSEWWSAKCRLGIPAHGISPGMDGCGGWECGVIRIIKGQKHRTDRLKCLGNAVVPQVAEWLGRRIMEAIG